MRPQKWLRREVGTITCGPGPASTGGSGTSGRLTHWDAREPSRPHHHLATPAPPQPARLRLPAGVRALLQKTNALAAPIQLQGKSSGCLLRLAIVSGIQISGPCPAAGLRARHNFSQRDPWRWSCLPVALAIQKPCLHHCTRPQRPTSWGSSGRSACVALTGAPSYRVNQAVAQAED